MKKTLLSCVVAILTLVTAADIQAAQTNLVQSVRVSLSTLFQGANSTNNNAIFYSVVPGKIANSDVIQSLGTSLSKNFSVAAKLLLITPLIPDGQPMVVVQDAGARVDVTGFFSFGKDDVQVEKGSTNVVTGSARGTQYTIVSLRLRDDGDFPNLNMHFRVRGFAGINYGTLANSKGQVMGDAEEYTSSVIGTADINNEYGVVRGTISVIGRQTEVQN